VVVIYLLVKGTVVLVAFFRIVLFVDWNFWERH
jgi:hypothetical protein